jgi:hypothetical protein
VAIYRIFARSAFLPEDVKRMGDAYERALVELKLADRNDPLTETVAQFVVDAAQTGEKDASRICAIAVDRIRGD